MKTIHMPTEMEDSLKDFYEESVSHRRNVIRTFEFSSHLKVICAYSDMDYFNRFFKPSYLKFCFFNGLFHANAEFNVPIFHNCSYKEFRDRFIFSLKELSSYLQGEKRKPFQNLIDNVDEYMIRPLEMNVEGEEC